jgi:hypothetical protein
MMLVRENNGMVDYASALPRAWHQDGKRIAFTNAPTYYGRTSLVIESHADSGTIEAEITPPDRKPVPLRLRLRHPDSRPIQGVTINGQVIDASHIQGEWIQLPAGQQKLKIVAKY